MDKHDNVVKLWIYTKGGMLCRIDSNAAWL